MAKPKRGEGTLFVLPGDPYQRQLDQAAFLEAMRSTAPEVLRSLRDEVLPAYLQARPPAGDRRRTFVASEPDKFRRVVSGFLSGVDAPWGSAAREVRQRLEQWANRFSIGVPWVCRRAAVTLEWWSTLRSKRGRATFLDDPRWFPGEASGVVYGAPIGAWWRTQQAEKWWNRSLPPIAVWWAELHSLTDAPPRWDPFLDPEGTFWADMEAYASGMKRLARLIGGEPEQSRAGLGWRWLARFQVRRESAQKIAGVKRVPLGKEGPEIVEACDRRNFVRTIRALAVRIDLPLRPRLRPGRPSSTPQISRDRSQ